MVSAPEVQANLAAAGAPRRRSRRGRREARRAAGELLPHRPARGRQGARSRERDGTGPIQDFLAETAQRHAVWLLGGTVPHRAARTRSASAAPRWSTTTPGRRVARYDKMHLFRFDGGGDERYDEARTLEPGPRAGRGRQPLRPAGAVRLLRCALPRAVPRARRVRHHVRAFRLYRADRRRALGNPAARARHREPGLRGRARAGRHARRAAGAPTATR